MPDAPDTKPNLLEQFSATKVLIGILIGGVTMWWSLTDRISKQVEEEVTLRVTAATKIARLEERVTATDKRIEQQEKWQQTQTERLNAVFQLMGKRAPADIPATSPSN